MSKGGKLSGRIALITGASRLKGIGAAICRALAKEGADIFFTYWTNYDKAMPWGVNEQEQNLLQQELEGLGVRCRHLELDLASPEAHVKLFDTVEQQLGKTSILVNNACYSKNDDIDSLDAAALDAHYAVNVRATIMLSVEFARRFSHADGGRIINLVSGQSLGPMTGEIAYASMKGAVEAFTLTFSAEVARQRITVNAVNPGPTDTGWMNEKIKQALLPRFPMDRLGQPEDAARLIAFLASDDAAWITGQAIHSEGGFRRA
jgi:3-oxoacyl-[acyl-carrier protein] reductase